jgi:hypothetical protein
MTNSKNQKIAVLTENADSDKNLILHGIKQATAFQKEVCLVYVHTKNKKDDSGPAKTVLEGYQKIVTRDIPSLPVHTVFLNEDPVKAIHPLVDEQEVILIIARQALYSKWSRAVRLSPVPFLFVNEKQTTISDYKKAILPVDLRKESNDAILWASYFARFHRSGINAIAACDKMKENKKSVQKNILGMKKLFSTFNLGIKVFKGQTNSLKIQFEALDLAQQSDADLLIILGSSYVTVFDKLIGLPEKKIMKKAGLLPVLLINPRKDMYILCD